MAGEFSKYHYFCKCIIC